MIVYACAPHRILDIGSWTDTSFAEHGAVLNCAINCLSRVTVQPITDDASTSFRFRVTADGGQAPVDDDRVCLVDYDFLRAAVRYFDVDGVEVYATSDNGPGNGFGIYASLAVAITGALATYAGKSYSPRMTAAIAHRLYTEDVGRVCGVEAFMAAAMGGVGLYHIAPYPRVLAMPVEVSEEATDALDAHLLLVKTRYTLSPGLHRHLTQLSLAGDPALRETLWQLRLLPAQAMEAICQLDYATLGAVIREHTELQQRIIPTLISPEIELIKGLACQHHALGYKVNGHGGSVTILCPPEEKPALTQVLRSAGFTTLTAQIDPWGLRVRAYNPAEPRFPIRLEFGSEAA